MTLYQLIIGAFIAAIPCSLAYNYGVADVFDLPRIGLLNAWGLLFLFCFIMEILSANRSPHSQKESEKETEE